MLKKNENEQTNHNKGSPNEGVESTNEEDCSLPICTVLRLDAVVEKLVMAYAV